MIRCLEDTSDRTLFWNEYARVRSMLVAAAAHNDDPDWERNLMRDLLGDGDAVLWTAPNSVAVTRIMPWNNRRTLIYSYAAGNIKEIMVEGEPVVEQYAKKHGCAVAKTFCRKGFERVLPRYGWQFECIVMTKEIDGEFT